MINMKQTPPDEAEQKEYVEVLRGGCRSNKALASFLDNDRKVLSFRIVWDDQAYDGGQKFYVLNFYLSDNNIEVKEINEPNTGRFPFPMLMKKQKLAKAPIMTHCPGMSLRKEEYYMPGDLTVGAIVNCHGRKVMIYDCDAYTRQWYQANLNIDQNPIALKKQHPDFIYEAVPPYNGFGTPEDSLGSVYSLQPKPPKVDMKKMFKQDMHILRFESKFISTEPDDESRKFIISFYCGDDTIQINEVCDKNSGRMGGKFLERKKHTNPVSNSYYSEKDFLVGRTIFLGGYKFQLLKPDEYTEKYMEDNNDIFKEQDMNHILTKIRKGGSGYNSLQEYAIDLMRKLDTNGDGVISFGEFTKGLRNLNIFVTDHEEHALMRHFDHDKDGKISMEEFYNTLAASF